MSNPPSLTPTEMKAVQIEWLDICSGTGSWTDLEALEVGPLKCVSVGMLVKETDECICIAQNYAPEQNLVADTMTYPKAIVTKVTHFNPD